MTLNVMPIADHFSGLTLAMVEDEPADLTVSVYRAGRHAPLRTIQIEGGLQAGADHHVFWRPIERSNQTVFSIQISRTKTAQPVACTMVGETIHSDPMSDRVVPYGLGFSPVTQCNLNCTHCISRFSRQSVEAMDDGTWKQIADHIEKGQIAQLATDYSGDILFSERKHGGWLSRIIETGAPYNIDTHANDLTADVSRQILASKITEINFSVDSLIPGQYEEIRRGGSLPVVRANIEAFMMLRQVLKPELTVSLSFVLMRSNLSSIDLAIDWSRQIGFTWVRAFHIGVFTDDMTHESLMLDRALYAREYKRLTERAAGMGVNLYLPMPVTTPFSRPGHKPCTVPWSTASVLGNGDVMACCVPGTKIGSLKEGTLAEAFNGPAMQAFRARVNTDDPPAPCVTCPMNRNPDNFGSYVPGLSTEQRDAFVRRVEVSPL